MTPVELLARNNEKSSIWFLYDHFNVNIENIAIGALTGNHQDLIKECHDTGYVNLYAKGDTATDQLYSKGYAEQLDPSMLKEYYNDHPYRNYNCITILSAFDRLARSGKFQVIDELLESITNDFRLTHLEDTTDDNQAIKFLIEMLG